MLVFEEIDMRKEKELIHTVDEAGFSLPESYQIVDKELEFALALAILLISISLAAVIATQMILGH